MLRQPMTQARLQRQLEYAKKQLKGQLSKQQRVYWLGRVTKIQKDLEQFKT